MKLLSILVMFFVINYDLKAGLGERCLIAISSEFRSRTTLPLPLKVDQCDLLICELAAELEFLSQALGVPLYVPYYLAKQTIDQLVVAVLEENPPMNDIVNNVLVKKTNFFSSKERVIEDYFGDDKVITFATDVLPKSKWYEVKHPFDSFLKNISYLYSLMLWQKNKLNNKLDYEKWLQGDLSFDASVDRTFTDKHLNNVYLNVVKLGGIKNYLFAMLGGKRSEMQELTVDLTLELGRKMNLLKKQLAKNPPVAESSYYVVRGKDVATVEIFNTKIQQIINNLKESRPVIIESDSLNAGWDLKDNLWFITSARDLKKVKTDKYYSYTFLIVGFFKWKDAYYLEFQNSWGPSFSKGGSIWIKADFDIFKKLAWQAVLLD